jgi:hypothetical protein
VRKREFIEIIQNILNGGDTTPDVKSKAHPSVVGMHIGNAIAELAFGPRKELLAQLAILYDELAITQNDAGVWYTALPVRPIAGGRSITLATDSLDRALSIRQSTADNFNLNFISPSQHCVTGVVRGKKLIYNQKPTDTKGTLLEYVNLWIVADFNELGDSDYVVVAGYENTIVRSVLQVMGYTNQIPEDTLNNMRVDREKANQ